MENYPIGAENDPNAPWNECEQPPINIDVVVSTSLSKTVTIPVTDYVATCYEEYEDGELVKEMDINLSECNFKEAYNKSSHTVKELLDEFHNLLSSLLDQKYITLGEHTKYRNLLQELEGWTEDELTIEQE